MANGTWQVWWWSLVVVVVVVVVEEEKGQSPTRLCCM
jgi:hypothetical protein